jgi:hypothetical protein
MNNGDVGFSDPLSATHKGPSLGALALVYVMLFAASLLAMILLTHAAPMPMPFGDASSSRLYYLQFPDALRINAFLQFGSCIPLGIFTASMTSRLKFLGLNNSGVQIALFGGMAASIFLVISSVSSWVQSQPGISNDIGTMRVVQLLGFITGGMAHVAFFGLLLAGTSITARFAKLIPAWLFWLGMITAIFAELCTLSMVFPAFSVLIPLGRFPGFIWMIIIGFKLPVVRKLSN